MGERIEVLRVGGGPQNTCDMKMEEGYWGLKGTMWEEGMEEKRGERDQQQETPFENTVLKSSYFV